MVDQDHLLLRSEYAMSKDNVSELKNPGVVNMTCSP